MEIWTVQPERKYLNDVWNSLKRLLQLQLSLELLLGSLSQVVLVQVFLSQA